MAVDLLCRYGLSNWRVVWIKKIHVLAQCSIYRQQIKLSKPYVEVNSIAHVRDTILHEIAHALAGANHGHDFIWKGIALGLGARPFSQADKTVIPYKWFYVCPTCGKKWGRIRRITGHGYCPKCKCVLQLQPA